MTFRLETMLPSAFESPWSPAHSQPFQYIPTPNPMPLRPTSQYLASWAKLAGTGHAGLGLLDTRVFRTRRLCLPGCCGYFNGKAWRPRYRPAFVQSAPRALPRPAHVSG